MNIPKLKLMRGASQIVSMSRIRRKYNIIQKQKLTELRGGGAVHLLDDLREGTKRHRAVVLRAPRLAEREERTCEQN